MLRPLRSPTWASVRPRVWRQRRTSRPTLRAGGAARTFSTAPTDSWLSSGVRVPDSNSALLKAQRQGGAVADVLVAAHGQEGIGTPHEDRDHRHRQRRQRARRHVRPRRPPGHVRRARRGEDPRGRAQARRQRRGVARPRPRRRPTWSCSPSRTPRSTPSQPRSPPASAGKVVIDVTNPLKADYSGLATEGGPSGAERLETAAHRREGRQGVQHAVRRDPGRPRRPRHDGRRAVRDRRRRGARDGRGPGRVRRLPPGPRRPAGRGPRARGDGLAQHPAPDARQRRLADAPSCWSPRRRPRPRPDRRIVRTPLARAAQRVVPPLGVP